MKNIFLVLVLISQSLYSQNITINGKIVDEITQQPIPFATIGVSHFGIGTISNEDGYFRLVVPQNATKRNLLIKQIGYKPKEISFNGIEKNFTFSLTPDPVLLNEVLVVPDNFIKKLIKDAYDSIKVNYSLSPILYTGFYRDAQFLNDTVYLTFIEAILNVFKDGYLNSHGSGQISILKSRKYNRPGMDSLNNVQFYGGAFLPIDFDFVYSHTSFINPNSFKKYTYTISETTKENGSGSYTVSFCTKDSSSGSSHGSFVLDKKTLAYLEINGTKQLPNKVLNLTPFHWNNIKYSIKYQEYKDKMHLSYAIVKSKGYNSNTKKIVFKEREFVTTSIEADSVRPIPFNKQLRYSDIINLKSENYLSSDWKDYTIIEPSNRFSKQNTLKYDQDESNEILNQKNIVRLSKRNQAIRFFTKINYRIGFNIASYSISNANYSISYLDKKLNSINISKQSNSFEYFPTLISEFSYSINQHLAIYYQTRSSLYKDYKLNDLNVGFRYKQLLFSNNTNWIVNFNIKYSRYKMLLSYGSVNIDKEIQISKKNFDASNIKIYTGKLYSGINPGITIMKKMGRLLSLYLESSYFIKLDEKDMAQFTEGSGFFLLRKTQTLPLINRGITFLKNSIPEREISIEENVPINISFGLSFDF